MSIDALAHSLIDLQQTAKWLLDLDDIDAWVEAIPAEVQAAQRLRSYLIANPVVISDDPAVKQLLAGIDLTELDDAHTIGMKLLSDSIVSPATYVASLGIVDIMVLPFQIPASLQQFLREARQCYAIGLDAAVQSLSRTILEVAVNDVAVRTGTLPPEILGRNMARQYSMEKRIDLVAGSCAGQVYKHYSALCTVVHGRDTSAVDGPLGSLTKTIGYVQRIYELNKEKVRANEPRKALPPSARHHERPSSAP